MNKAGGKRIRVIESKGSSQDDPMRVGALVEIIDGTHKGKEAKIINVEKKEDAIGEEKSDQYISVELLKS